MSYNAPIQQKIYRWSSSVIVINIYICCTAVIAMHSKPHRARNDVRASGDHGWGARGCSRKNYMQCENREGRNWMMLNGTSMKCIGKERVYTFRCVYIRPLAVTWDRSWLLSNTKGWTWNSLGHPPPSSGISELYEHVKIPKHVYIYMYVWSCYIYILQSTDSNE